MQGIRPSRLTDRELARYAELLITDQGLPKEWAEELLQRFEEKVLNQYPAPETHNPLRSSKNPIT
jgi:hypothetical protein